MILVYSVFEPKWSMSGSDTRMWIKGPKNILFIFVMILGFSCNQDFWQRQNLRHTATSERTIALYEN